MPNLREGFYFSGACVVLRSYVQKEGPAWERSASEADSMRNVREAAPRGVWAWAWNGEGTAVHCSARKAMPAVWALGRMRRPLTGEVRSYTKPTPPLRQVGLSPSQDAPKGIYRPKLLRRDCLTCSKSIYLEIVVYEPVFFLAETLENGTELPDRYELAAEGVRDPA